MLPMHNRQTYKLRKLYEKMKNEKGEKKEKRKEKMKYEKTKDDVLNSKHPPPPLPLNYHFLPSILSPLPTHKYKYIKKKTT